MASLAATNWPKPIPLVPCLSWSTASPVFTQGVMSASINWALLENQFLADEIYQNDLAKMVKIVGRDDAFFAGQHFAQHYPASMARVNELRARHNNETESTNCDENSTTDETVIENKLQSNCDNESEVDKISSQLIEEKAAARIFPLNLISNKFKTKDLNILKGICLLPVPKHPVFTDYKWRERKALQFMCGIMDECTHLKNFAVPVDTKLIIAVCARDDAYVPRDGCMSLEQIWPGVEIRYIDAGHVTAYLLHQKLFRSAITEAFERSLKKYPVQIS